MERHVDLSLLRVRTEVSDWLMVHVCHVKFPNHLMSRLYTSTANDLGPQMITDQKCSPMRTANDPAKK